MSEENNLDELYEEKYLHFSQRGFVRATEERVENYYTTCNNTRWNRIYYYDPKKTGCKDFVVRFSSDPDCSDCRVFSIEISHARRSTSPCPGAALLNQRGDLRDGKNYTATKRGMALAQYNARLDEFCDTFDFWMKLSDKDYLKKVKDDLYIKARCGEDKYLNQMTNLALVEDFRQDSDGIIAVAWTHEHADEISITSNLAECVRNFADNFPGLKSWADYWHSYECVAAMNLLYNKLSEEELLPTLKQAFEYESNKGIINGGCAFNLYDKNAQRNAGLFFCNLPDILKEMSDKKAQKSDDGNSK